MSDSFGYLSPCNNSWYPRAYPRVKNEKEKNDEPSIPVSFLSDLDWFCCSVLTLRQNSKTSPKRFKTTPKFVTFKLLIYSNVPKCIYVPLQVSTCCGLIPRGGTPYNGPYGEAPPEMGTFLRLHGQGYERVGISLVEVYESVGRSVISVCNKRVQKG